MTTWKDGGNYGRYCRGVHKEEGSSVICYVWIKKNGPRNSVIDWPKGEANFRLILRAPETAEALRVIAEGAIVSPEQQPGEVAEQVLRVLRLVREENLEYLKIIGMQQKRAEQAEEALEAIVALRPPRWPDQSDILRVYHQCKEIARATLAATKENSDETELV